MDMGMTDKQFAAFCRKLLREFNKIEDALDKGELDRAKELITELKEDTQKDIEE